MSNENKKPKSKATMLTLLVCIVAVLSGKPISEVLTEVSSSQETIATEQTVDYDYDESIEETVEAVIEEDSEDFQAVAGTDTNEESTYVEDDTTDVEVATEEAGTTESQEVADEETADEDEDISFSEPEVQITDHKFRSKKLLNDHYKKHGLEMGFESAEEYVENANRVISSPDVLYKLEEEDNDHVYYLEETNEFVVVSQDGYIRTYFNPSAGIDYFNRQ